MNSSPILKIDRLTIAYRHNGVWLDAVRDVSLRIDSGQVYGLVGESGSGKSTLALAIMRYLGENGRVQSGTIEFAGLDLLAQSEKDMRHIWGARIGLVPQDPLSSLNPSIRIGEQIAEVLRLHKNLSQRAAAARAIDLLAMVRVPDPPRVAASYPHQTSGGMQQRVMIAMALGVKPQLLVLDEPTTGLDVTTEAAVLDLIGDLIREHHTSALYVTHNLGVVARICDRVGVLYAGDLVEDASTAGLYAQPLHPYTVGLLDSIPRIGQNKTESQLQPIRGRIPTLNARPSACVFAPRCPLVIDICHSERPALDEVAADRLVRCHRWHAIQTGEIDPHQMSPEIAQTADDTVDREAVLRLNDLEVLFPLHRSIAEVLAGEPQHSVHAVDGVNLELTRGRTLGLVGESGSGKTTLARAIIGLVESTSGSIELLGMQLPPSLSQRSIETLRHLQIVFQNPEEALNPYLTIGETLSRPLITLMGRSQEEAQAEVERLLSAVRLPPDYAQRLPGQLSGGEKQRVAIARAFATTPDLLIFDEPVSALDVSVQASILNLLGRLQAEQRNASLFISHDLAVVGYLADDIAVIYAGQLMEIAQTDDLFKPPYHPYTEALLSAIPLPDPNVQQEQIRLEGDVPNQLEEFKGCPFYSRCPRCLGDICFNQKPPWQIGENGNRIYCHIPLDELRILQKDAFITRV